MQLFTGRRGGRTGFRPVAITAAVISGVLAASAAAAGPATAGNQPASGVISTLAGGPGGPEDATNVALKPCGVTYAQDGQLYISVPGPQRGAVNTLVTGGPRYLASAVYQPATSGAVQQMSPGSSLITPFAGAYALRGPVRNRVPATSATMSTCSVAEDQSGNLVIADRETCRVRVVAGSTGTFYKQAMTAGDIYTVAGHGACGFFGDGGKALRAGLDPIAVQVDAAGNLVIVDGHNRVRVVAESTGTFYQVPMTAGHIYTIAGNGHRGFSGDGGKAIHASLNQPDNLVLDATGNLVISDTGNCRVRVVAAKTGKFYGRAMTAGDIYTIAGDGSCPFAGDGGPATSAGLKPQAVAVDSGGDLVIADAHNRVRVVAAKTGTFYGRAMTARHIYTIAGNGTAGFSGDEGPATSASLSNPKGVAVDAAGNVVIADSLNDRVRVVAESSGTFYGQAMTTGDIYTIAGNGNIGFSGDGGPFAAAEFRNPGNLTVSADGSLVVVDYYDNKIRLVPATSGTFFGQAMTAGDIYTIAGNGHDGYTGDNVLAVDAGLNDPQGVAVDAAGNLVIADTETCRVRLVADSSGTFYGIPMTAGYIYTIAGNGHHPNCGFTRDGSPATGTGLHPAGVALDASGNLVIADNWSCRVLVVANGSGTFYGIPMTAGDIYSVAGDGTCSFSGDGGPATSAGLSPGQVAIDAHGNLVIPDSTNDRVRVVAATQGTFYGQAMTAGDIYTIAGDGTGGFSGDGGPATGAELNDPSIVAIDAAGNVAIADYLNDRVRVVAATPGTFYGQAMTAGDIYTVAGNGTIGFSGDGGPGTGAELSGPEGLAVDGSGNLLISDGDGNNRIREVAG